MADSLFDILSHKDFDEPPEATTIKAYVQRFFKTEVGIAVGQQQIIISVPNAALAGALRPHLYQMAQECATKKRLVVRIGR